MLIAASHGIVRSCRRLVLLERTRQDLALAGRHWITLDIRDPRDLRSISCFIDCFFVRRNRSLLISKFILIVTVVYVASSSFCTVL